MSKIIAKVTTEASELEGPHGKHVGFEISVEDADFGVFKCQLDYRVKTKEMADAVRGAVKSAEKLINGMDVNLKDAASVNEWTGTVGFGISGIMGAIVAALPK